MISSRGRPVLVIVGGRGASGVKVHDACYVYDVTGEPSDAIAVPCLPEERAWAAVVSDRKTIFVVGGNPTGQSVPSRTLYKFTLTTMTWSQLSDMKVARKFHTACLMGHYIVVVGGIDDRNTSTKNTECYHIKKDIWYPAQDYLASEKHDLRPTEAASCAWRDQCVVSGGRERAVGSYNIQNDTWTHLTDMVHGRRGHSMACVDDRLFVFGGSLTSTIEMYDPNVGQFSIVGDMGVNFVHNNAVTYDSKVLVGGNDRGLVVIYDASANEVTQKTITMPPTYSQAHLALLYITFPSLKELCLLKILSIFRTTHNYKGVTFEVIETIEAIEKLEIPQSMNDFLVELAFHG